ncbi:uncharacterized protein LOC134851236 [Symsagittifera roscoffensis]|uniref:uncharacterized protein LOC134851236 n=1 Tax=Symsagittifera roscoffensis TaxID=84072 RepID=UPI00307B9BE2
MENNNNNSSDASQWSVFKSQHCRIWFGVAQQFDSTGKTTDVFRVMHSYKPRLNSVDGSEIEHSNVYYYDDDRGTVTSSPRCGPWFYKEEDSITIGFKGVKHPKWPNTKFIFFPTGSGIMFNNSAVNYGSVETCVKLFVLHPQRPNIRLSVMVEYCELTLQSCKVYFENSDGWKSPFWEEQESHDLITPITPLTSSVVSRQTIDFNLNFSSSQEDPKPLQSDHVFSFDSDSIGSIFDNAPSDYLSFNPTKNVTITCPKFMKPNVNSSDGSLNGTQRAASFVAVRWNQAPDNCASDVIAEFDLDTRFKSLTEIHYKHSTVEA